VPQRVVALLLVHKLVDSVINDEVFLILKVTMSLLAICL